MRKCTLKVTALSFSVFRLFAILLFWVLMFSSCKSSHNKQVKRVAPGASDQERNRVASGNKLVSQKPSSSVVPASPTGSKGRVKALRKRTQRIKPRKVGKINRIRVVDGSGRRVPLDAETQPRVRVLRKRALEKKLLANVGMLAVSGSSSNRFGSSGGRVGGIKNVIAGGGVSTEIDSALVGVRGVGIRSSGDIVSRSKQESFARVWRSTKGTTVLSKVSVGGGKYLVLKKLRVTVSVQGLRARTVIDHIYYNPHGRTLQGTFKYTLPAGSSVSYYAMFVGRQRRSVPSFFVGKGPAPRQLLRMKPGLIARLSPKRDWGKLREARLVPAEKGRKVFEDITRRKIDPALLQQNAPNTFSGKVFPIPAKGYNRIIIAYEQTLSKLRGEQVYRFSFPPEVAGTIDFALVFNGRLSTLSRNNLRAIRCRERRSRSMLRCYWEGKKPDRDAVFYFRPRHRDAEWVAGTDPTDGKRYLYTRLQINLPAAVSANHGSRHAVIMLDTSLSTDSGLFSTHVALLKQILRRNAGKIEKFNLLFFDAGAVWARPGGWIANTEKNRRKLFRRIKGVLLEGATGFAAAMKALAAPPWPMKAKVDVDVFLLSDGNLNWGEVKGERILSRFQRQKRWGFVRFFAYQFGKGSENRALYHLITRSGGALFSCLGRSELSRCAVAHTKPSMLLQAVSVNGIGASEVLVSGRKVSIYPGGHVVIAARYTRNGGATITLKGQYLGKPITLHYRFHVKSNGDHGPRAWAELAINQLIGLDDPAFSTLIVAYAQHFRIPNKHCSFLVLETDRDYRRFGLEKTRKAQRVGDLANFLEKKRRGRIGPSSRRKQLLALIRKVLKRNGMLKKKSGGAVLSLLAGLHDRDFEMPEPSDSRLIKRADVPGKYPRERLRNRDDFRHFIQEARRRLQGDVGGAVRSLSSIVELHPGNPRAMRLVGYYLMSWNRPAEAAHVFLRVLERRSFEPHSWRDLARALIKMRRYVIASALYEVVLGGRWHRRFGRVKKIAREEYAMLMQRASKAKGIRTSSRSILLLRKSLLGLHVRRSKLRVTVTWNTDKTDIDLWVIEPTMEKCYYSRRRTSNGGVLFEDITRGYGPERYSNFGGRSGRYQIKLNYYGHNSNVFGNQTLARVLIVIDAGTASQRVIEKNVVLTKRKQIVTISNLYL